MAEEVPMIIPKTVSESGSEPLMVDPAISVTKKKRLCRYPGCTKVIKSQGHCQRHGAKAKRCKVEGCEKQAQGTHDGMCKRHWKALHFPEANAVKEDVQPPPPEGESIYDSVLPQSISYKPSLVNKGSLPDLKPGEDPPPPPGGVSIMPLVEFLREGAAKEPGWHRNSERRARGLFPVGSLASQLEPWERQLALVEILLLSGGTAFANFKDLAHAWGREKGFHHVLASNVCERRGEVERKKRSDAGKTLSDVQRENFRSKLKRARSSNASSNSSINGASMVCTVVPAQVDDPAVTANPLNQMPPPPSPAIESTEI